MRTRFNGATPLQTWKLQERSQEGPHTGGAAQLESLPSQKPPERELVGASGLLTGMEIGVVVPIEYGRLSDQRLAKWRRRGHNRSEQIQAVRREQRFCRDDRSIRSRVIDSTGLYVQKGSH